MRCPVCSSPSHVNDSRVRDDGAVRRRRTCLNEECRHRFTSREVTIRTGASGSDDAVAAVLTPEVEESFSRSIQVLLNRAINKAKGVVE